MRVHARPHTSAVCPLGGGPQTAATPEQPRPAERLVGRRIPPVALDSFRCSFDLCEFACVFAFVLYLYPGVGVSSPDGEDTPRLDNVQHRAFRAHQRELEALEFQAIGVSSQSTHAQQRAVQANRLEHRLLSDPRLLLARELGLPTRTVDGARWYQRLTLIVTGGRIEKAFFPVRDPARSPARAIAWIRVHGSQPGAGADAS